jgi:hypothetical protein
MTWRRDVGAQEWDDPNTRQGEDDSKNLSHGVIANIFAIYNVKRPMDKHVSLR